MASTQRYPSPTRAQPGADGPFYGQPPPTDHSPAIHDREEADELELREVLYRGLDNITTGGQPQSRDDHGSPHQYDASAELQAQLTQSGIHTHEESPVDQSLEASAKDKSQRQKVSRACDECRRKKASLIKDIRSTASDANTRFDATRLARAALSHAQTAEGPMSDAISLDSHKREGRAKGKNSRQCSEISLLTPTSYIKQLAERLNTLESQMAPGQGASAQVPPQQLTQLQAEYQSLQQQSTEFQNLQPQLGNGRQNTPQRGPENHVFATPAPVPQMAGQKRTHDMFEASNNDLPDLETRLQNGIRDQQYSQSNLSSPNTTINPTDNRPTNSNSRSNLQPFFKHGGDSGRRESVSIPIDSDMGHDTAIMDWDEEVVDEYYRLIHQTFPLLPHSKHRLQQRLGDCPPSLREAFVIVLGCMMRTFPSSILRANQSYAASMKRAAELLAAYPFENPSTHNTGTNLVYLQILLLMALESDNHGPATMRGQAGPSRSEWLGRAAGVAGQLEINLIRPQPRMITTGDPDSEDRLARRVWWVLFILDRWHASSTADLLKLPENSVVLLPEDQIILGESTYHLARLSFIIGHLAAILTTTKTPETNVMAPSNPASSLLGLTLAGEIDRFRESVESVWGSLNLVHLSYHHSHLLIKRLNPTTEPSELIGHALKVATVLNQRQTPITPLNHHFGALSAMTLCELVEIPKTASDAAKGLDQLAEALGLGRGLAGHTSDSTGWDSAIRELVVAKRAKIQAAAGAANAEASGLDGHGGQLQTLVDAEASRVDGLGGSHAPSKKFDPTWVTKYGYLTALGQGMFHSG